MGDWRRCRDVIELKWSSAIFVEFICEYVLFSLVFWFIIGLSMAEIEPYAYEPLRERESQASGQESDLAQENRLGNAEWCQCCNCENWSEQTNRDCVCCVELDEVNDKLQGRFFLIIFVRPGNSLARSDRNKQSSTTIWEDWRVLLWPAILSWGFHFLLALCGRLFPFLCLWEIY